MIRLLTLLLALSLIVSPSAGGHAEMHDGAIGGDHEMEVSLHGEQQRAIQCPGDDDQSERSCCEFMMGCNVDVVIRTVDTVPADNSVSIGQYVLRSDHRDSIEFLADPPPPRT